MKKLTAGIFSVLVGLCAADSAYAAIASEAWVDQVFVKNATYTTDKAGLESAIEKAQSDAEATAAGALASTKSELEGKITAEETARKNADKDITDFVGTLPEGATATTIVAYIDAKTSGIASEGTVSALDTRVGTAEGKITALETKVGNDTVSNQIDAKIAALDLANTYDAKGAAGTAETNAKSYTDTKIGDLGENVADVVTYVNNAVAEIDGGLTDVQGTLDGHAELIGVNTKGIEDLSASVGTVAEGETVVGMIAAAKSGAEATAAADATSKADAALVSAKGYTDTEIDKLEASLGTTSGDLTTLTGRVDTAEGEIDALQTTVGNAESGLVKNVADNAANAAKNAQDIAKNAQDIAANTQNITANANAISALEETVNDETTGVAANAALAAQNAKAVADNATAIAANTEAIGANTKSIAANLTSIQTINNSAVMKSGITAEKVSDYDTSVGVTTGIAALTTGSDGTYVLTAKVADGKITGYTWEDITRAGN